MPRPTIFLRKACPRSPSRLPRLAPRQSGRARWRALRSRGGRFPHLALRRYPHPSPGPKQRRRQQRDGRAPAGRKRLGTHGLPSGQAAATLLRMGERQELHGRIPAAERGRRIDKTRHWARKNVLKPAPKTNEDLRLGSEPGRHPVLRLVLRLQGAAVISPTARARAQLMRQDPGRRQRIDFPPKRGRRKDKARRPGRKNALKPAPITSDDLRHGSEPDRRRALRPVLRLQEPAVISAARAQAPFVLLDFLHLLRVNVPPKQDGSPAEHGLRPPFVLKKGAAPTLERAPSGTTIGRVRPGSRIRRQPRFSPG